MLLRQANQYTLVGNNMVLNQQECGYMFCIHSILDKNIVLLGSCFGQFVLLLLNVISHGDILILILIALAIISLIYSSFFVTEASTFSNLCSSVNYFSDLVSSHSLCCFCISVHAGKQYMTCGFAYQVYVVLFSVNSDPTYALYLSTLYY